MNLFPIYCVNFILIFVYLQWPEINVNLPGIGSFIINPSFFKKFDYSSAMVIRKFCFSYYFRLWWSLRIAGRLGLGPLEIDHLLWDDWICSINFFMLLNVQFCSICQLRNLDAQSLLTLDAFVILYPNKKEEVTLCFWLDVSNAIDCIFWEH